MTARALVAAWRHSTEKRMESDKSGIYDTERDQCGGVGNDLPVLF